MPGPIIARGRPRRPGGTSSGLRRGRDNRPSYPLSWPIPQTALHAPSAPRQPSMFALPFPIRTSSRPCGKSPILPCPRSAPSRPEPPSQRSRTLTQADPRPGYAALPHACAEPSMTRLGCRTQARRVFRQGNGINPHFQHTPQYFSPICRCSRHVHAPPVRRSLATFPGSARNAAIAIRSLASGIMATPRDMRSHSGRAAIPPRFRRTAVERFRLSGVRVGLGMSVGSDFR